MLLMVSRVRIEEKLMKGCRRDGQYSGDRSSSAEEKTFIYLKWRRLGVR